MSASSNQQETVMDTQKVETSALLDDELDAVTGGAIDNKEQQAENKAMNDAIKFAQQALQEL
jgi:hypothetical protein